MRTKTDIYHRMQATLTLCYGFTMRVAYKTPRGGPGQAHDRRQYRQDGKVTPQGQGGGGAKLVRSAVVRIVLSVVRSACHAWDLVGGKNKKPLVATQGVFLRDQ